MSESDHFCWEHDKTVVMYDLPICPLCDALSKLAKPEKPETPKLNVKAGYRYKQRCRMTIDITDENMRFYRINGKCDLEGCRNSICAHDLVEELGPTPLTVEVGKRYADENGCKLECVYFSETNGRFLLVNTEKDLTYCTEWFNKNGEPLRGGLYPVSSRRCANESRTGRAIRQSRGNNRFTGAFH